VRVEGFSDVAVWGMRGEYRKRARGSSDGGPRRHICRLSCLTNPQERKGKGAAAFFYKSHLGLSAKAMANYLIKRNKKKILLTQTPKQLTVRPRKPRTLTLIKSLTRTASAPQAMSSLRGTSTSLGSDEPPKRCMEQGWRQLARPIRRTLRRQSWCRNIREVPALEGALATDGV